MSNIQKILDMAYSKARAKTPIEKSLDYFANQPMDVTKESFVRKYHIKDILKYKRPEQLIIDVHKALDKLSNNLSQEERNILLMKFLREWRDANVE